MHSTIRDRRVQRRILYWNTLVWSIGNALTSSIVLVFTMEILGYTSPLVIALIFAAPFLGRTLQPFLSSILKWFPFRRKLCVFLYWAQVLALWLMLGVYWLPSGENTKFWLMLAFWTLANLFEMMAYAVFLSWNRLLFPGKTLGRFYSWREIFRVSGEILPIVALAIPGTIQLFSGVTDPPKFATSVYLGIVLTGSLFILASSFFLWFLPEVRYEIPQSADSGPGKEFRRIMRPFRERKFWPFLIYSALFSFLTQFENVSQTTFQKIIFCGTPFIPFLGLQALKTVPRFPQIFLAPWVGKLVDRYGTLNVMICSQLLTAVPLLFYVCATPETGWLLYVAALLWGSYVGLNVALPKFMLENSAPHDDTPWLTAYGFAGSLAGTVAVMTGGFFCHAFSGLPNYFTIFFSVAFCWRLLLALPLMWGKWRNKGKSGD